MNKMIGLIMVVMVAVLTGCANVRPCAMGGTPAMCYSTAPAEEGAGSMAWILGGLAAAGGVYLIGDNNEWFGKSSDDNDGGSAAPVASTQVRGDQTIIIINGDNNDVDFRDDSYNGM